MKVVGIALVFMLLVGSLFAGDLLLGDGEPLEAVAITNASYKDLSSAKIADYSNVVYDKTMAVISTDTVKNIIDKPTNSLRDCRLFDCEFKVEIVPAKEMTLEKDFIKGISTDSRITFDKPFFYEIRQVEKERTIYINVIEEQCRSQADNKTEGKNITLCYNVTVQKDAGTEKYLADETFENTELSKIGKPTEIILRAHKPSMKINVDLGFSIFGQERWDAAWWNATYTKRFPINCSLMTTGTPLVINGSGGVFIDGLKQIVWTRCDPDAYLYYLNNQTYAVANNTTQMPMKVEFGNGTDYTPTAVWTDAKAIYHLGNSIDTMNTYNLTTNTGTHVTGLIGNGLNLTAAQTAGIATSNLGITSGSNTMSVWVYPQTAIGNTGTVYIGRADSTTKIANFFHHNQYTTPTYKISAWRQINGVADIVLTHPSLALTTQTWTLLTQTFDVNTGNFSFYVNGEYITSTNGARNGTQARDSMFYMNNVMGNGAWAAVNPNEFDQVEVFSEAKSPAYVLQTYNNVKGVAGYGMLGISENGTVTIPTQTPSAVGDNFNGSSSTTSSSFSGLISFNYTPSDLDLTQRFCSVMFYGNGTSPSGTVTGEWRLLINGVEKDAANKSFTNGENAMGRLLAYFNSSSTAPINVSVQHRRSAGVGVGRIITTTNVNVACFGMHDINSGANISSNYTSFAGTVSSATYAKIANLTLNVTTNGSYPVVFVDVNVVKTTTGTVELFANMTASNGSQYNCPVALRYTTDAAATAMGFSCMGANPVPSGIMNVSLYANSSAGSYTYDGELIVHDMFPLLPTNVNTTDLSGLSTSTTTESNVAKLNVEVTLSSSSIYAAATTSIHSNTTGTGMWVFHIFNSTGDIPIMDLTKEYPSYRTFTAGNTTSSPSKQRLFRGLKPDNYTIWFNASITAGNMVYDSGEFIAYKVGYLSTYELPLTPSFISPTNTSYYNDTSIDINYTNGTNLQGYPITATNLTLLNPDYSVNKTLINFTGSNLTYSWNPSSTTVGQYMIGLRISDSQGNAKNTSSEVFTLQVRPPPTMNTSTILPSPAYTNSTLLGYCNATSEGTNVTYTYTWYLNGAVNTTGNYPVAIASAVGGTKTTMIEDGVIYTVHIFTANDTFNITGGNLTNASILIVAGGGGGGLDNYYYSGEGHRMAGGGGAGGLIYNTTANLSGNYSIVVGSGGLGGTAAGGCYGAKGQNSSAFGLTAVGGGGGIGHSQPYADPAAGAANGGSGGGSIALTLNGNATAGQGNNGGTGSDAARPWTAGGGGGAGASGGNSSVSSSNGGGGIGLNYTISGNNTYYAGGGGGAGDADNFAGSGGTGGGGAGNSMTTATSGTPATGGGGGGKSRNKYDGTTDYSGLAGAGGSGVVIVRYVAGTGVTQGINTNVANISNALIAADQNWTLQCTASNVYGSSSSPLNSSVTNIITTFSTSNGSEAQVGTASLTSPPLWAVQYNVTGSGTCNYTFTHLGGVNGTVAGIDFGNNTTIYWACNDTASPYDIYFNTENVTEEYSSVSYSSIPGDEERRIYINTGHDNDVAYSFSYGVTSPYYTAYMFTCGDTTNATCVDASTWTPETFTFAGATASKALSLTSNESVAIVSWTTSTTGGGGGGAGFWGAAPGANATGNDTSLGIATQPTPAKLDILGFLIIAIAVFAAWKILTKPRRRK